MRFLRTALLLAVFASPSLAHSSSWEIKDNCDVATDSLKTIKSVSQDACQQACDGESSCQGFVYITGWKRCLLKSDMRKQAKLRFISGDMNEKHGFDASQLKSDFDHSGKDLERKVVEQPELCAKACSERSDCQAFTYLDGYRVCWLKAAGGHLNEKMFRCGVKK